MAISAHDLLMNADVFKHAYPSWPHAEPEQSAPPLSFVVLTRGQPDRLVTEGDLPALLAGDAHVRLQLAQPGAAPLELTLCMNCPQPGFATVCIPGEPEVSEPVVVAEIKISDEEKL